MKNTRHQITTSIFFFLIQGFFRENKVLTGIGECESIGPPEMTFVCFIRSPYPVGIMISVLRAERENINKFNYLTPGNESSGVCIIQNRKRF